MGGKRKILRAIRRRNENSGSSDNNDSKKKKPNPQQQNKKKNKDQQQQTQQKTNKSTIPQLFPVPSKKVRSNYSKDKSTSTTTTKDKILASKKLSESMKCPSTSTSNKRGKNDNITTIQNKSLINKRTKTHGKNIINHGIIPLPFYTTTTTTSSSSTTITIPSTSTPKQNLGVELKLKTKGFKIPKKNKSNNSITDNSNSNLLKKPTMSPPPSSSFSSKISDVSSTSSSSSKLLSNSPQSTLSSSSSPSSVITSTTSLTLEHASGTPTTSTTIISKNEAPGIPLVEQEEEEMDWEDFCIKRNELTNLWPKSDQISSLEFDGDEMEIDSFEPLIIVPDTNIWIGALSLIRELLDTKFKYYAYPTIVIPWMVLQELDVQGKNHRGPSRQSIIYIHKLLSSKHPRVRGQKASDACTDVPNFDRLNADDSIIQCAQQQKQNNPSAVVILLTNDKNMMNKALVNDILGVDSKSGIQGFTKILNKETNSSNNNNITSSFVPSSYQNFNFNRILDVSNNNNNNNQASATQFKPQSNFIPSFDTSNNTNTPKIGVTITNTTTHFVQKPGQKRSRSPQPMVTSNESKKYKFPGDIQQQQECEIKSFQEVLELVRQVFSYIIETKMKEDYGEPGWLNALKIQPPWSLRTATQCIVKHWFAVFCEVFGRRSSQAEKLEELLKQYEQGRTSPENEEEIIESVLGLFTSGEFAQCPLVKTDAKIRSCRQTLLAYNKRYNNSNTSSNNNKETMNKMT